MSIKLPTVNTCCGVGTLRWGFLLCAYLKVVANVLIVVACFFLMMLYLAFKPIETAYPFLMFLTMALLVCDVLFTFVVIIGAHMENLSLLHLYCKYSLLCGVSIIVLGSIWMAYFMIDMRPQASPSGIFIMFASITSVFFMFHAYFVVLTHSVMTMIKSSFQSDLPTTLQALREKDIAKKEISVP